MVRVFDSGLITWRLACDGPLGVSQYLLNAPISYSQAAHTNTALHTINLEPSSITAGSM